MSKPELKNIYYRQNKDVEEYMDVFFETDKGVLQANYARMNEAIIEKDPEFNRLEIIDVMRTRYGKLYLEEVRRTYDNDMFFLLSGKFILAIEFVLNSNFKHSTQEFRKLVTLEKRSNSN